MTILKAGKLNPTLRGACFECGCEIEFATSEALFVGGDTDEVDLSPGSGSRKYPVPGYFYRCPTVGCGDLIHGQALPRKAPREGEV